MNDPFALIIALGLLLGGPSLFIWSKEFTLFESRFNLWAWYRFLPSVVEPIYGKKEDLPNSKAVKVISWWHKLIGVLMTLMGILWLGAALFGTPVVNLDKVQSVKSADGAVEYVLFADSACGGFGDPGWTVFEIDRALHPEDVIIPCSSDTTQLGKKSEGVNLLLSNYSEDGSDTSNPRIEIIEGRFLVMSRGNLRYGLYDTQARKTLFNEWSPWGAWTNSHSELSYADWVRANVDQVIAEAIAKVK